MNQGSPEDGIHVLIVGAGLGGLLLAQGLKKVASLAKPTNAEN